METIAIVIAEDEPGLMAMAHASGLTVIDETVRAFDGLETFSYPTLSSVGVIRTGKRGWIALAMV